MPPHSEPGDGKQKLDCEFFLIELARDQIELGGNEAAVTAKERIDWERWPYRLSFEASPRPNRESEAPSPRSPNPEAWPLLDKKQEPLLNFLNQITHAAVGATLEAQMKAADKAREGKIDESQAQGRCGTTKSIRPNDSTSPSAIATFLCAWKMPDKTARIRQGVLKEAIKIAMTRPGIP